MDLILFLYLVGLLAIALVVYYFFGSFLVGAGYQPTPPEVARRMLELGKVGPGERVYDLGAGTGTLLFPAAARGAETVGFEAEPFRYFYLVLRRRGCPDRARVTLKRTNFFHEDLTGATVIFAFLWPGAMTRLRPKFERELARGTRVVSYWHAIPGWDPQVIDRRFRIYLYVR